VAIDRAGGVNQLLDALPAADSERVLPLLTSVFLELKTVLFEPGGAIEAVHFPRNCVVSLVTPLHDGTVVEVASVGNEGIVGVPLLRGGSLAVRAICSVAGWADRMDAPAFLTEIERDAALAKLASSYLQALFGQVAQAAACNRLHSNEERLSRWLLMSHDRVGVDTFAITHDFLGQMLGSRRATVSLSAQLLQTQGLIKYRRGRMTILDRAGLEAAACECYSLIERELDGVVQSSWARSRATLQQPDART
jgi:CRP-like cAMP-binding protein